MILNEKNLNLEDLDKVNDLEDARVMPINLNGVFNRVSYLLLKNIDSSIFCEAKVLLSGNTNSNNKNNSNSILYNRLVLPLGNSLDPLDPNFETVIEEKLNEEIKNVASGSLIDTHYFPKNSDNSKQHLLQRLGFHIEVIYWSTILNFYNMKFIMEKLGIPFECSITKKDVEFNVRYWMNKVTASRETANNEISMFFSQMNVNENIEQMKFDFQNYYMFCQRLGVFPFLEFMKVREDRILEMDGFRNKLKIRVYRGGKSREKGYDKVRSLDNQFCLYIPNEMKMKLYSWYKTDKKECRTWINKELEDSFMIGKVYSESDDEYYGTHFLFQSISKYICTNEVDSLGENDIFGLKLELHSWIESVKNYMGICEICDKTEEIPLNMAKTA